MKQLLLALTLLLTAGTSAAAAQESEMPSEVRIRNNCRLAAQVLTTGHPHQRTDWARAYIVNCVDEGPAHFSAQWASAPADTSSLRELIHASTRIRDARVFNALKETAVDRSRADAVRVAAMIGLLGYVDIGMAVDLTELKPPSNPDAPILSRGGSVIDVVQVSGSQPVGYVATEILELLNGIAADRDREPRVVWYAAAVLARRIGFWFQFGGD